ncbi:hypothetical protein Hanom_Chr06g00568941 [Helianthus anomalus]
MCGMCHSSTGCVLRAKPNKKWARGHGLRPSSTGCALLFLSPLSLSSLSLSSLSFSLNQIPVIEFHRFECIISHILSPMPKVYHMITYHTQLTKTYKTKKPISYVV